MISLGPRYRSESIFDLTMMQPYAMSELLMLFRKLTHDVVLYLPRTSDLRQIAKESHDGRTKVVHYCMQGASKVSQNGDGVYRLIFLIWYRLYVPISETLRLYFEDEAFCLEPWRVVVSCSEL